MANSSSQLPAPQLPSPLFGRWVLGIGSFLRLRTSLTLLPLLQPLLLLLCALFRPRFPIGALLLQLLLLIGAEQRVHVRLQPGFGNREIRLNFGKIFHCRSHLRLVEGSRFDRLEPRVLRRTHPVHERAHLLAILLRELTHLLLLRIGEVERPQRQAGAWAARAEARSASARPRVRRTLREGERASGHQAGDEDDQAEKMRATKHGDFLHRDVFLVI